MSIKPRIEAIIYAAEEPIAFAQLFALVRAEARQELLREREAAPLSTEPDAVAASEPQTAMFADEAPGAEIQADGEAVVQEPGEVAAIEGGETPEAAPSGSVEEGHARQMQADVGQQATVQDGEVSTADASPIAPEPLASSEDAAGGEDAAISENTASGLSASGETAPSGEAAVSIETAEGVIGENPAAVGDTPATVAEPTEAEMKSFVRAKIEELIADFSSPERGIEVRQIAGGYRMATKPEHHDAVRSFAKSLKPPVRLSMQALETLAVIAYKQPITAPEISEVRGVDCGGVLGTLLDRKFITTAGRKQVVGRPILYKTTKEFLLRFGLKDVNDLPSMEEFEKLAAESLGADLFESNKSQPAPPEADADESERASEEVAVLTPEQVEAQTAAMEAPGASEPGEVEAELADTSVDLATADSAITPEQAEAQTVAMEAPVVPTEPTPLEDSSTSVVVADSAPTPEQAAARVAGMEAPLDEALPSTDSADRQVASRENRDESSKLPEEPGL